MDAALLLGLAAGFFTTISYVPQIQKIWKTKSAEDVSKKMFLSVSFGVFLWLVYGLLLGAWPIIVANAVTLALAVAILAMKIRWSRKFR